MNKLDSKLEAHASNSACSVTNTTVTKEDTSGPCDTNKDTPSKNVQPQWKMSYSQSVNVNLPNTQNSQEKPLKKSPNIYSPRNSNLSAEAAPKKTMSQKNSGVHVDKQKVLLIGNSHFKSIIVRNFIKDSHVEKHICYKIDEASTFINSLKDKFSCVVLHRFTNDVQKSENVKEV